MGDEPQPVARAVRGRLLDRALARRPPVLVEIALAIQVTSWWETSGASAVTRPPAPRRGDPLAVVVARVPERTAVRDDDQLRAVRGTARAGVVRGASRSGAATRGRRAAADLDLVGDRPDDRDPEAALGELPSSPSRPRSPARSRRRRRRPRRSGGRRWSSKLISTWPPPSPYAWRTEFEHASVSASFRSASVSSASGRTRERPDRASRDRVMYSGFAGIVSRTVLLSSTALTAAAHARSRRLEPLLDSTESCRTLATPTLVSPESGPLNPLSASGSAVARPGVGARSPASPCRRAATVDRDRLPGQQAVGDDRGRRRRRARRGCRQRRRSGRRRG